MKITLSLMVPLTPKHEACVLDDVFAPTPRLLSILLWMGSPLGEGSTQSSVAITHTAQLAVL